MSSLDSYDGTHDPFDHISTFKTTMHLQGIPNEIMCRAFPTTLKRPARVWFSKIPLNTVSSFEELSELFVNNFIGGQKHKHSSSSLLTIEQGENEMKACGPSLLIATAKPWRWTKWTTSCYWQPSIMELTLIYSSISFMSKSLKPWLNSSIQLKTSWM